MIICLWWFRQEPRSLKQIHVKWHVSKQGFSNVVYYWSADYPIKRHISKFPSNPGLRYIESHGLYTSTYLDTMGNYINMTYFPMIVYGNLNVTSNAKVCAFMMSRDPLRSAWVRGDDTYYHLWNKQYKEFRTMITYKCYVCYQRVFHECALHIIHIKLWIIKYKSKRNSIIRAHMILSYIYIYMCVYM